MDCDSTKKPHKKFKSSLVYPDYINRLWRLLKDKSKILEICVDIKLLNSDSQNPQNNNSLLNNISCFDIVSTNFYKSVSYLILQNNNTTLNFKFILYPNTSDNSTLLFLELSSFYEEQNETFLSEIPKLFLEDLSNYLKNNPVFLYEYESIILNCDIVPIWNYIINETNFDQNFLITNKKEYHHDLKKVGDTFMYKLNENEVKVAKVTKIDRDFVKKQWTFLFDLYNSKDDDNVECEVSFFLLITKQNNIFLSYHHDFKTPIEQSELNNLAKDKKKFLNEIKNYFEKK